MNEVLERLRKLTCGTEYEGRLYLVGGIVRDRVMRLSEDEDIDIVLEGDALNLARFVFESGIADHAPVSYSRFGTAMIAIGGVQVEFATARSESYSPESRKPAVTPATLEQDVRRRDFTINTLLENLHTGQILDLTGKGFEDIERGVIQTPVDPEATFDDDPLRMLRAVRFAARFGFAIDEATLRALVKRAPRLKIVSGERIRDEFSKMLMGGGRTEALEMLRETRLLSEIAPELSLMHGVTQNIYHLYDVWTHTLKTVEALPEDSGLVLRLAALFHDVGKPHTRTIDENMQVHFYTHQQVGASITRKALSRLHFPNDVINRVVTLVDKHLRVGEYGLEWSDAAVRRLVRDAGDNLELMIALTEADKAAANTAMPSVDIDDLRRRIQEVSAKIDISAISSPLDGHEIMEILDLRPGPDLKKLKDYLTNEVLEGRLAQGDKESAKEMILLYWRGGYNSASSEQ